MHFVFQSSIPVWLDWMKYLSWFQYGFEALSINQWDGMTACFSYNAPNNQSITDCIEVQDKVLDQMGFEAVST